MPPTSSTKLILFSAAPGLLVAMAYAPKDRPLLFFGNFAWLWLPQVALAIVQFAIRVRIQAICGSLVGMALYIFLFGMWVRAQHSPEPLWFFYVFALPIGLPISVLLGIISSYAKRLSPPQIAFAGFVITSALFLLTTSALARWPRGLYSAHGQPNQSLSRTQGPLSYFTYNGLDYRSPLNVRLAVGPAFLRR